MDWTGQVWQLRRGDELLGEITVEDQDFPWLSGRFTPQPGFAEVAPLFAEELALMQPLLDSEASDDQVMAHDAVYARITGLLSLVAPYGPVAEFLLHIDGSEAWFRWSDEPFDDD